MEIMVRKIEKKHHNYHYHCSATAEETNFVLNQKSKRDECGGQFRGICPACNIYVRETQIIFGSLSFLFDVSQEENNNYNLVCIYSYRAGQLTSNRSVENVLMDIWPRESITLLGITFQRSDPATVVLYQYTTFLTPHSLLTKHNLYHMSKVSQTKYSKMLIF